MQPLKQDPAVPGRFSAKTALITAAASGIGRETALRMAQEGATVVAVDIDREGLASLAGHIESMGGTARTYAVDVTQRQEVIALVNDALEALGGIHVLVNAVGGSTVRGRMPVNVEAMEFDDWQALLSFNLSSMFLFTSLVVPAMKRRGNGSIVNLSSIAARGLTVNSSAAYSTAKGGVISFTRKLAHELGPHGINVNAVAPGLTLTQRMQATWEGKSDDERRRLISQIPLRRLGSPQEQAAVVCFLASADASFVTGTCIDVTGGQ